MRSSITRTRAGLFTLALALILTGSLAASVIAQEATPDAGPITRIQAEPGVTIETFAAALSDRAPGQTIYVGRLIVQPGAEIHPHYHPGTTVLGVVSGSFGWTLLEGSARVVRGAGSGGTTIEEVTEPGTEVILEPGDAIYYEDDVVHTARGASEDETVVHGTLVLTTDAPVTIPVDLEMNMGMEGTPEQ